EFPGLSRDTFYGLPALLADALPDTFGNALVDAWMAEQGVAAADITPLDRLAYAADRAMGALQFRPPAGADDGQVPTAVQLADLVLAARLSVRGELAADQTRTGETAHAALQQLIQVGTSAGGARAKAVVAFNPASFQVHSSFGDLPPGFEQWLIKLDGVSATGMDGHGSGLGDTAPYGRIEYAYSLMAAAAGVEMAPCQLLAEGPRRHFMTRRFDRGPGGERIHMISLCALAHLDYNLRATHSYDQYLQTVTALDLDLDALAQAYRRMVFNVVAVNRDDHTKNFAFLRGEGDGDAPGADAGPGGDTGGWRLAPAFDLTHAYSPTSRWTRRHLMAVNAKFDAITLDDVYAVGDRHHVPAYRRIVRQVMAAVEAWSTFAGAADLDDDTTAGVATDLEHFRLR